MNLTLKWYSKDGLEMYARAWEPDNTKAIICLVHGMGEHCHRYDHFAEYFKARDIAVLTYDQRGHGRSGGKRGHTPSYAMLMHDVAKLLEQRKEYLPDAPTFLYGHSFGGNLVSNYVLAEQPQIAGAIVTGSLFKLGFEPPKFRVMLGKMMSNFYGAYSEKSNLNAEHLSRSTAVVKKYMEDIYVHGDVTARMFVDMLDSGNWALKNAAKLSIPMLVMHGSADQITKPAASVDFANEAGDLASLKLWDGFYHEIHNEPEQKEVFDYVFNWMDSVLEKKVSLLQNI